MSAAASVLPAMLGGFKFLDNGCSWYETHRLGGCLRPDAPHPKCTARAGVQPPRSRKRPSLAVLIPYRGAGTDDVLALCSRLPEHLSALDLRHRIFVVNQSDPLPFNRGALVNAAVSLLGRELAGEFDYLAVQDVDRFPSRSQSCASATSQYYAFPANQPRVLHPFSFTGGVLVIRLAQYRGANGFSNQYWGWGEEDNDFFMRLRWCGWPPRHGEALDDCMEHMDCIACRSDLFPICFRFVSVLRRSAHPNQLIPTVALRSGLNFASAPRAGTPHACPLLCTGRRNFGSRSIGRFIRMSTSCAVACPLLGHIWNVMAYQQSTSHCDLSDVGGAVSPGAGTSR